MDASVQSQNGVSESPVESNKCLTEHLLIVAVIWKDFANAILGRLAFCKLVNVRTQIQNSACKASWKSQQVHLLEPDGVV